MNRLFSKIKAKYPLAAAGLCIIAYLAGKPLLQESFDAPVTSQSTTLEVSRQYTFRSREQLEDHYEKHGIEMGFDSAEEYLAAANRVIASDNALQKPEAEDNDFIFYLEESNEFVILSQDGYIRTYFFPSDGIDYYNRQ